MECRNEECNKTDLVDIGKRGHRFFHLRDAFFDAFFGGLNGFGANLKQGFDA